MSAATIDDIPLEILQEIFLLACHNLYYLVISKFHNDLPFQHTLLAVSRRWMHAAASFPVLWSNIRVSDGYGNAGMTYPCPSSLVAALTTAIQHAGKALISCVINLNESGGPPSAAVLELLPFLIPSSRQWVSLCVYGDRTVPHVFLPLYRNLPLLKSLEITFDDGTEEALSHIFSEAPSLVSVDIKLGENGVGYILPWPQLQRACIRARGPPLQCLQNFTRAPQLEFLRYSDCTHGNSSLNIGLVTLSSVKEVDVESGLLFPLLALPSLEIATIKAHFLDSFKLMVSHSGCRIRALTIETFSSFPPMEDLEGHLPTLARLKMDAYDRLRYKVIPRDMMKLLTELEFLRGKFFGLEELWISLSCHGIDVWEGEDLVKIMNLLWEMVSSRRRMKRITLHLVFSTSSDWHVLDVGGLDQIDSFRKLKQVHARETPHVDLAIVYVDSSDEIHLMDADPQLTMTLYPHRVIFH